MLVVALLVSLRADVHPLALAAKDTKYFCLLVPSAPEPMGNAGIELGHLPRPKDQVMVTEHKAHPSRKDIEPLVAFVGLQDGLDLGRRDDDLPGLHAPGLAGQRDDRALVGVSGLEADTGITDFRCADQLIQGHAVSLGQRQEQLQARAPLAGLQPGQRALRNTSGCCKTRQRHAALHAKTLEPHPHLVKSGGNDSWLVTHNAYQTPVSRKQQRLLSRLEFRMNLKP